MEALQGEHAGQCVRSSTSDHFESWDWRTLRSAIYLQWFYSFLRNFHGILQNCDKIRAKENFLSALIDAYDFHYNWFHELFIFVCCLSYIACWSICEGVKSERERPKFDTVKAICDCNNAYVIHDVIMFPLCCAYSTAPAPHPNGWVWWWRNFYTLSNTIRIDAVIQRMASLTLLPDFLFVQK